MTVDYGLVLSTNYPGTSWSIAENDYDRLEWFSEDIAKPSREELDAAWPAIFYPLAYQSVEQARQIAYRETADPIFFEYQRGDKTEQEWLDAVQAVKDAHPYPEVPNA